MAIPVYKPTTQPFPTGTLKWRKLLLNRAVNLGKNLLKPQSGWQPFIYRDKGAMAIIVQNKTVADISHNKHCHSFFAWLLWLFVHVMSLVNYRNRLRTLYNWVGAYFSKDQVFRMITRPEEKDD